MYEPLKNWLRAKGLRATITHTKKGIGIWVGDLFVGKEYIEPDVIGISSSWLDNVCIEAKARIDNIFEVIGKCSVWQLAARSVYLAVPEDMGFRTEGLKLLGLGLLTVNRKSVKEIIKPDTYHIKIDNAKAQELFNQAYRIIKNESPVLVSNLDVKQFDDRWEIHATVKNEGSKDGEIMEVLCLEASSNKEMKVTFKGSGPTSAMPYVISPNKQITVALDVPKKMFEGGSLNVYYRVRDGLDYGGSAYLSK